MLSTQADPSHAGATIGRHRERLCARLDRTLDPRTRLAVIAGPPGYGKTTAVEAWLRHRHLRSVLLTLSAADADPARFAHDLLAILDPIRPGAAAASRAVGGRADPAEPVALLLDALAARDDEIVVVLDDVHRARSAAMSGVLDGLVAGRPPFVHLVLVAREDPPLPLGRLRAAGALVELRAHDLALDRGEIGAALEAAGLGVAPGDVDRVLERTEGWPAAVQLVAIASRDAPDATRLDTVLGGHAYLADYLADEVVGGFDPVVRDVLTGLAVLGVSDAGTCAAITGIEDAGAILEREARLGLVASRDGGYRVHGLLADALHARLAKADRARLHREAAEALTRQGRARDAVAHAMAAEDWDRAAALIVIEGRTAFEQGEVLTLLDWIDALPPGAIAASSDLVALRAWALFETGRMAEARAAASDHLDAVAARGPAEGRLLVVLALLSTTVSPDAAALARDGLSLVGDDHLFRGLGLQAAGLAALAGGRPFDALETLRQAFSEAQLSGCPMAVLGAVNPLGHALQATGRRDEAERLARQVVDEFRGPGGAPLAVSWTALLALGIALYEAGDIAAAYRELERGLAAATALGVPSPVLGWAIPTIALAREAVGDTRGAIEILHTGSPDAARTGMVLPSLAAETEARIRLARGDLPFARRWTDEARSGVPIGSPLADLLEWSMGLVVAQVRLAEGRPGEALEVLAGRSDPGDRASVPERISALILAGRAHQALGDREAASRVLREAVRLAAPGGYAQRFADLGSGLLPLLRGLRSDAPDLVRAIEEACGLDAAGAGDGRDGGRIRLVDGILVESLTDRESEVLRELATGASNAILAARLGMTAGTAKWHVAHILGKLGARSRTEAVVRGQRLGLL